MKPFQERVIAEKAELDEKLTKLNTFFATAEFGLIDPNDRVLLYRQAGAMETYSDILARRIERFK